MKTSQTNELRQLQEIADTDNLTSLALLQAQQLAYQTARLDFQTEMIKHLKDAEATKEATKWVQELHENNQEAEAKREAKQQEKDLLMDKLNTRFKKDTEAQTQKSIDISDQQPEESGENNEVAEEETSTGNDTEEKTQTV